MDDEDVALARFREAMLEYFEDLREEGWDLSDLVVVPMEDEVDPEGRVSKVWRVEWLAGPPQWAFASFFSPPLPPGTWADPWHEKELHVHFS